jgi:hypothetical protein
MFALIVFIVNKQEKFETHADIHSINTTKRYHLDRPVSNLSYFQNIYSKLTAKYSTVQ